MEKISELLELSGNKFLGLCQEENFQGKGPGGQKKNRVKSGVRMTLEEPPLSVTASEYRETERNRSAALQKLRLSLALSPFTSTTLKQSPEEGWQGTRMEDFVKNFREDVSSRHADFPMCAFTALACLADTRGELKPAATLLGTGTSRLVKFLSKDKATAGAAQRIRLEYSKPPLKF